MKTLAPVQLDNLGKSFTLVFVFVSIVWGVVSFLTLGDIYVSLFVLALNVTLSAILGWYFYKRRYHTIFSYDDSGFEMQVGKAVQVTEKWQDFATVSLVHLGYGQFAVRLYREGLGSDFVDIPASALKLDPFAFRSHVTGVVKKAPPRERRPATGIVPHAQGQTASDNRPSA